MGEFSALCWMDGDRKYSCRNRLRDSEAAAGTRTAGHARNRNHQSWTHRQESARQSQDQEEAGIERGSAQEDSRRATPALGCTKAKARPRPRRRKSSRHSRTAQASLGLQWDQVTRPRNPPSRRRGGDLSRTLPRCYCRHPEPGLRASSFELPHSTNGPSSRAGELCLRVVGLGPGAGCGNASCIRCGAGLMCCHSSSCPERVEVGDASYAFRCCNLPFGLSSGRPNEPANRRTKHAAGAASHIRPGHESERLGGRNRRRAAIGRMRTLRRPICCCWQTRNSTRPPGKATQALWKQLLPLTIVPSPRPSRRSPRLTRRIKPSRIKRGKTACRRSMSGGAMRCSS